jgi:hypothetical protein
LARDFKFIEETLAEEKKFHFGTFKTFRDKNVK